MQAVAPPLAFKVAIFARRNDEMRQQSSDVRDKLITGHKITAAHDHVNGLILLYGIWSEQDFKAHRTP